jgi:hypothetical protein
LRRGGRATISCYRCLPTWSKNQSNRSANPKQQNIFATQRAAAFRLAAPCCLENSFFPRTRRRAASRKSFSKSAGSLAANRLISEVSIAWRSMACIARTVAAGSFSTSHRNPLLCGPPKTSQGSTWIMEIIQLLGAGRPAIEGALLGTMLRFELSVGRLRIHSCAVGISRSFPHVPLA